MSATALLVAGTAISAFSAVQAGQAAGAEAEFRGKLARRDAEITRQRAADERTVARQTSEDFRRQQSRLMATRRAALGASGVEGGEGSPLLAMEDFASEAELQALRIEAGGETRATRLEQTAGQEDATGRFFDSSAGSKRFGGFVRGGSLLLSGLGKSFA